MPSRLFYSAYSTSELKASFKERDFIAYFCPEEFADAAEASVMVTKDGFTTWNTCPILELDNKLRGRSASLPPVKYLVMGTHGRYYVEFQDGKCQWNVGNNSDDLDRILRKHAITSLTFGPNDGDYAVIYEGGCWWACGVPVPMMNYMKSNGQEVFDVVALSPVDSDAYFVHTESGKWRGYFGNNDFYKDMNKEKPSEYIRNVCFGGNDTYFIQFAEPPPPPPPEPERKKVDTSALRRLSVPRGMKTLELRKGCNYVGGVKVVDGDEKRFGEGVTSYESDFKWKWFSGKHEDIPAHGVIQVANGSVYHGSISSGEYSGWGSLQYNAGSDIAFYTGMFSNGIPHGIGMRVYTDGRQTIGWFSRGRRHGPAVTFYNESDRNYFLGSYDDDGFASTHGSMHYCDGRVFTGNVKTMKGSTSSVKRAASMRNAPLQATADEQKFLNSLVLHATALIEVSWKPTQGRTAVNWHKSWKDGGEQKLASFQKFLRGLRLLKDLFGEDFVSNVSLGAFGWHGTSEEAVSGILKHGFDVSKRRRQNHGPGEYTATSWREAICFTGDDSRAKVVLSFSLPGPHLTAHSSFCSVTSNPPAQSNATFMIPLATIAFDRSVAVAAVPRPPKTRVWQFLWEGNCDGQWHPYHPDLADQMASISDTQTKDTNVVLTHPRHDNQPEDEYMVGLSNDTIIHEQVNLRTGYTRKVKEMRKIPALPLMNTEPAKPTQRRQPEHLNPGEQEKRQQKNSRNALKKKAKRYEQFQESNSPFYYSSSD